MLRLQTVPGLMCGSPPAKGEAEGTAEGEEVPNAILFRPYDLNENKKAVYPTLGYGTRYGDIPPVLGKLLQEWEEMERGSRWHRIGGGELRGRGILPG